MIRRIAWTGLFVTLAFWAGCTASPEPQPTAPEERAVAEPAAGPRRVRMSAEAARAAGVETALVETASVPEVIEVAGQVTLDEDRTARVGSFVEGVVVECCKSVGAHVREGDVLARVHSHATHEIVAEYTTAKATLRSRESELEYARQAHERAAKLLELKAGSLQTVQRAQTDVQAAEASLAAAQASLRQALAHLDYLGLDPASIESPAPGEEPQIAVRAPSSGVIVARAVKLGDVVTPSTEMYVLSDLSRVWVIGQVPEALLGALRSGMRVEVQTRAFPDRVFPGRVTHVSTDLDPETRTVQVRCSVANPAGELKTGMYAGVKLESGSSGEALTVPEAALQRLGEATVLFVAAGEDAFEIRPVREGRRIGDRVEVVDGLSAGERIATAGAFVLKSEHLKAELRGQE